MKAIEQALRAIQEREVQIINIKNYIDRYRKNVEEVERDLPLIIKALEKGGFSEIVWLKDNCNRLRAKELEAKEILEPNDSTFIIEVSGKCKGYVGSKYDNNWDKKVAEPLQKKKEKIETLLPEGYSLGTSGFYAWSFQVVNAGEVVEMRFQIYKK